MSIKNLTNEVGYKSQLDCSEYNTDPVCKLSSGTNIIFTANVTNITD